MSSNPEVLKVQDPRLDIVKRDYLALQGASNITHQAIPATTYGNSQLVFSTTTPSVNTFLSRRMYIKYQLKVSFSGDARANPEDTATEGFRAFPLSSCAEVLTLKLNNQTITINLSDVIHPLQHFGSGPKERNEWMSGCPAYADQSQEYNLPTGEARNPFTSYGNLVTEVSRNAGGWEASFTPGAGGVQTALVSIPIIEPLFISPLNWSDMDVQGLAGVQNLTVQVALGNLARAWSQSIAQNGVAGNDVTKVEFADKPELLLEYMTPQINRPIPNVLHYPYYSVNRFIKDNGAVIAPGAAVSNRVSDNITFHSVPKRIYVYLRSPISDANVGLVPTITDSYASISKVDINWDNRAGVLSSATAYQLHQMATRAGSDQSFPQFSQYQGSILCFQPGIDIPLNPLEAAGSLGNYQFQITVDSKNVSSVGKSFNLYVVAVFEGFMRVEGQQITLETGVLTEDIINRASDAPPGSYHVAKSMFGGSFLDTLKSIGKGILKGIKVVAPVVGALASKFGGPRGQAVATGANVAGQVASALGAGRKSGGRARSAKPKPKPKAKKGGRSMSRSALKSRR